MDTLGVGLIGTGYMGKCHALAWNAVASVFGDVARPRLALLCDSHEPEAQARALGFARATPDWRVLVGDKEVDIVSITTPNQFHAEMAIAALENGKHVWCEKPMATTLADAARMRDAARASGKLAVLGYNYIQNPVMRLMRALIADDVIGPVTHLRIGASLVCHFRARSSGGFQKPGPGFAKLPRAEELHGFFPLLLLQFQGYPGSRGRDTQRCGFGGTCPGNGRCFGRCRFLFRHFRFAPR